MNKVIIDVKVEKKVDNRVNNTGRPVNKKSNRQQRLAKQQHYANVNDMFVDYIGRTKVTGYTFVLGKRVNVELNLKTLPFVK